MLKNIYLPIFKYITSLDGQKYLNTHLLMMQLFCSNIFEHQNIVYVHQCPINHEADLTKGPRVKTKIETFQWMNI